MCFYTALPPRCIELSESGGQKGSLANKTFTPLQKRTGNFECIVDVIHMTGHCFRSRQWPSWAQALCLHHNRRYTVSLIKLNFQAVIKSAASAASPIAWGEPRSRRPLIIIIRSRLLIFKHPSQKNGAVLFDISRSLIAAIPLHMGPIETIVGLAKL